MAFSTETNLRTLQLIEAMARQMGLLPPLPEDHPAVPTVTKSIGTVGRDYSTMTAWEADLDNSGIYASGDTARGEDYDDSVFDESVTINGGGTVGLADRILTVAAGEQGDGTAGTGVRVVASAIRQMSVQVNTTVERLEWNCNDVNYSVTDNPQNPVSGGSGATYTFANMIVHSCPSNADKSAVLKGFSAIDTGKILNTILYDISRGAAAGGGAAGIFLGGDVSGDVLNALNVTVHNVRITNASKAANVSGIEASTGNVTTKNSVATDTATVGSGTPADFSGTHDTSATNASSDSTAPSPIATEPVASAVEFVSVVVGSEDLHLAAGAECNDAGTDLGTTPTGVNISMPTAGYASGYDRDADPDGRATPNWAVGADEPTDVVGFGGISQVLGGGIIAA